MGGHTRVGRCAGGRTGPRMAQAQRRRGWRPEARPARGGRRRGNAPCQAWRAAASRDIRQGSPDRVACARATRGPLRRGPPSGPPGAARAPRGPTGGRVQAEPAAAPRGRPARRGAASRGAETTRAWCNAPPRWGRQVQTAWRWDSPPPARPRRPRRRRACPQAVATPTTGGPASLRSPPRGFWRGGPGGRRPSLWGETPLARPRRRQAFGPSSRHARRRPPRAPQTALGPWWPSRASPTVRRRPHRTSARGSACGRRRCHSVTVARLRGLLRHPGVSSSWVVW